jgi:DNA-binding LacI/PurR family transcriptional regulator
VDVGLHNDRFATLSEIAAGLLEHNVAGLLLTATPDPSIDRVIADLRARGVIVVLVARYLESMFDLDYVGVDNERIGYEATRHLLELGHTGVVHLAGTRTSTVRDRTMGYVRAMRELDLHPRICIPPLQSGYASPEVLSVLGDRDPALLWAQVGRREITAAFCFNDAIASWVQKEIRMLNLSMPRDVSVVGVDNMPYADFFDAPLTTFALPGDEIAGHAVELLVRRLNGENFAPERVLLPARFMLRRSTAPPPNRIISVTAVAAQPR